MDLKLLDESLDSALPPVGLDPPIAGCFPLALGSMVANCAPGRAGSEFRMSSKIQGGELPPRYGVSRGEGDAEITRFAFGDGNGSGKSPDIGIRPSAVSFCGFRRSLLGRFLLDPAVLGTRY